MDVLLLLAGGVLLLLGGEALVRGATGLALLAKVTPATAGLTVVAAGTSMPELFVSVQAGMEQSHGLAVGNVVGSSLFNITAIVGLTALIRPFPVRRSSLKLEWPFMFFAGLVVSALAYDLGLSSSEGIGLLMGLVVFLFVSVGAGKREAKGQDPSNLVTASMGRSGAIALLLNLAVVAVGIATLGFGSTLLIDGAVGLAQTLGVSELVIGLTIVGMGTGAPELATSVVAALRGESDLAVANVLGSNVFNLFGILGAAAVLAPMELDPEVLSRDLPAMLGSFALTLPIFWSRAEVSRWEGALLLAVFAGYCTLLVWT